MSYLIARPLALFCAVFLLSGGIYCEIGTLPKLMTAATALISLLICLLPKVRRKYIVKSTVLALSAIAVAAILSIAAFDIPENWAALLSGKEHLISGVVTDTGYYSDYLSIYEVKLSSLDGAKTGIKVQLTASYPLELEPGDGFEATALFELFSENYDGYPEAQIMHSHGIFSTAEVSALEIKGTAYGVSLLSRISTSLGYAVNSFIGGDEGGLVSALLLGDRSQLSLSLTRDFRALGLSHIIALSGLHLAILIGSAEKLLRALTCPRRLRIVLLCAGTVFFTVIVGAPLSVVRAALMFIIYQLSFLFGERRDQLTALMLAVTLICIVSPASVSDCALRLSFAATLGILSADRLILPILINHISSKGKFKAALKTLMSSLIYSICATVFTLPFSWLYFGRISLVSPLSTLVATPLVTIILTVAPIMLLLSPVQFLAAIPASLCKLAAHIMIALSAATASPGMTISLQYPFAGVIIALTVSAVTVIFILNIKHVAFYVATVVAGITAFTVCLGVYGVLNSDITEINFVTHKSSEAICLSHSGETVFCDISDGSRTTVKAAGELLGERVYDDSIEIYMLTHYHRRHLSTFYDLTQREFIKQLILPEPVSDDELALCTELLALAEKNGVEPVFYRRGGQPLYCVGIEFESIERSMISRSTHPLLAMKISGFNESVLYIGGATSEAAAALGDADTVVLGAHGPKIKESFSFGDSESAFIFLSENVYIMWSGNYADAIDPSYRIRLVSCE